MISPSQHRDEASGGFTLVEILVAFTIAALCLGVLLRVYAAGLDGLSDAQAHRRATLWAESKLERLGIDEPLAPGNATGRLADGYRWNTRIERYNSGQESGRPLPVRAYLVTVEVRWPSRRGEQSVALTTLRLQPQERQ